MAERMMSASAYDLVFFFTVQKVFCFTIKEEEEDITI